MIARRKTTLAATIFFGGLLLINTTGASAEETPENSERRGVSRFDLSTENWPIPLTSETINDLHDRGFEFSGVHYDIAERLHKKGFSVDSYRRAFFDLAEAGVGAGALTVGDLAGGSTLLENAVIMRKLDFSVSDIEKLYKNDLTVTEFYNSYYRFDDWDKSLRLAFYNYLFAVLHLALTFSSFVMTDLVLATDPAKVFSAPEFYGRWSIPNRKSDAYPIYIAGIASIAVNFGLTIGFGTAAGVYYSIGVSRFYRLSNYGELENASADELSGY